MKYAEKGYLCDSLLLNREGKIEALEKGLSLKNEQLELSGDLIRAQKKEIEKANRNKNIWKFVAGGGWAIALGEFVYILIKSAFP